jgi:hypothetical protein
MKDEAMESSVVAQRLQDINGLLAAEGAEQQMMKLQF